MYYFSKKNEKGTLITIPEVKKKWKQKKKNELTFLFVQEPFVRLWPFIQVPFLKKKNGNVNYVPQSNKKTKTKKKEQTYLFVRSETARSGSTVRPGSIPKKKDKRTLITFPEVKKKTKQKKRTNLPFCSSSFDRSSRLHS